MVKLLDLAKSFLQDAISENSILADFTMGNGYDTEYLCKCAPHGKVYAFDVQKEALENTRARLDAEHIQNAVLIHDSHSECKKYIIEKIDAGMFNLGYRPGSDKTVFTLTQTTLCAVKDALDLLKLGGVLVVSVYPGHEEGTREGNALCDYLSTLDRRKFCVLRLNLINSPDSPFILVIEKYNKPNLWEE